MTSKFRINAKSVFLTYPQCDLQKEHLLTFINTLKYKYSYAIICTENHEDGNKHLHAVIKFKKKVDIRNEHTFDLNGFHPNIQTTKNINASINYVKKDGDYIEDGILEDHVNSLCSRIMPDYNEVTYRFLESLFIGYE